MSAHADYAASDNIYGIINTPIVAGMNAVGVSLLPMDPAADRLHDVILPDGLTFTPAESADSLWTYNGSYQEYYLSSENIWTNGSTAPAATLGMGAWIKATAPATIYQVGIVTNAASFNVAAAATGASFIANPFPTELDVNTDIDWTGIVTGGASPMSSAADRLLIWNGAKYDYYYYAVNGETVYGWYSTANKGAAPLISAGEGFFLQRKSSNAAPIPVDNPLD